MRTDLGPADSVSEGGSKCVTIGAKTLALFKVSGTIYCLENQCTHLGGPLCKGRLDGSVIQCPWHGSRFDVRTGAVVGPPARTPVKAVSVTVEGGHVWADVS
jgi:3-phenylpropionate/trans-cinnamate dioxygenase ferredoxin component